jgi:hypothetical protein
MNTSFQLNGKLLLAVVVFLACSFGQAGGGPAALADEDLLDAILEAHRQSCKKMESAIGTGTLEVFGRGTDEKEYGLRTQAKVDVQFHKDKYGLRFDYVTLLEVAIRTDENGKATKKFVEGKPDALFVIDDGTSWTEVQFSSRIKPTGCSGSVHQCDLAQKKIPWRDLAQMSKCIDPEAYVKNLGRDKLTVLDLPSGIRRISGRMKDSTKARFELDADPKAGFNITAQRVYYEPNKEPTHTKEIVWKNKAGIWYGEQIMQVAQIRNRDGTPGESRKEVFRYEEFSPNAEVKPAVFTLAATGIPRGAWVVDHRPGAPVRKLYYDGQGLTPERPGK